jgi:hypothetical protein
LPGVGTVVAAVDIAAAIQKIKNGDIDKAADADRGVGAGDQERSRKAATRDRCVRGRLGARDPYPIAAAGAAG